MFFKKRNYFKLSRMFNKPINLFNLNIKFLKNDVIEIKDSLKSFFFLSLKEINLKIINNFLYFKFSYFNKFLNIFIGTFRSLLFNIILGFVKFYEKKLFLFGIGYKVILKFNFLHFYLGYSHPIIYKIPLNIKIEVFSFNNIILFGINKQKVNQIACIIKNFKFPDSYKGKGVRYLDEILVFKNFKKK